jgi:NAD-dependent SIR2 family protein deacetylase
MILEINGTLIQQRCQNCYFEFPVDVKGSQRKYNSILNEYENFSIPCPSCNSVEHYNMNLPNLAIEDVANPLIRNQWLKVVALKKLIKFV